MQPLYSQHVEAQVVRVEHPQRRQHVRGAVEARRTPPPTGIGRAGKHDEGQQQAVVTHFLRQVNGQVGQSQQQSGQHARQRGEQRPSQLTGACHGDHACQHAQVTIGELAVACRRPP